ncbi:neurogenic locus notch homolog protein 1-like [Dendronephthya gigantea]|uniref:neurogenic locus notch homolog protein 1-like n=1 Tax=Dendronephthya gigantea TaxID=151771 RepID=UPI00106C72B1|nr:neurogenic locus notch homolog protein 1-like [Dendronephthya gigantea]
MFGIGKKVLATKNENILSKNISNLPVSHDGPVSLDYHSKKVYAITYWAEKDSVIEMDYYGRGKNQITQVFGSYIQDVIGGVIYWKTEKSIVINIMNISSKNNLGHIRLPKSYNAKSLLVVDKNRQPKDIDECLSSPCNRKGFERSCKNTPGSFVCTCKTGTIFDGVTCSGRCVKLSCLHGYCSNTNGSEICHCDKGFKYNGYACTDIDECMSSPCNQKGFERSCKNTPGSFICTCKSGTIFDGVTCSAISELQIRLNDSSTNMSGRVEIYHPTFGWGTICNIENRETVSSEVGEVICRQLGFAGVGIMRHFGEGSGPVLLSEVSCIYGDNEIYIWDCSHAGWNMPTLPCTHDRDVGVECY